MTDKRVQIVELRAECIDEYFRGNMAVIEGLPDDATLKRTWEEPARQTYCFMFESDQFPTVEEGAEPPRADLVVAQRRVNTTDYWVCPNCNETLENGDVRCK